MDHNQSVDLSRSYFAHRSVICLRRAYAQRLPAARPFLLGIQSLVQQHFEVRLVPQPFLGGEGSGSREVIFRQPDRDRWRSSGLAGPFAGNARHGSLAEFARGFGLLKAVRDKVLIFCPPFGLLCLSLKGWLFLGHRGSPLSFLVVKLNEPFDWFESRYNTYPVFAPCSHHEKNAALNCRTEVEIALLPFDDLHSNVHRIIEDDLLRLFRQDAVKSHVADIRFVPIELNLGPIHVLSQVYLVCRYT